MHSHRFWFRSRKQQLYGVSKIVPSFERTLTDFSLICYLKSGSPHIKVQKWHHFTFSYILLTFTKIYVVVPSAYDTFIQTGCCFLTILCEFTIWVTLTQHTSICSSEKPWETQAMEEILGLKATILMESSLKIWNRSVRIRCIF